MMKILRIIIPAFVITFQINVFAQQDNNKIVSLAMVTNDSILLRWVPASLPVWQAGNRYGYIVERYTIAKDGKMLPEGLSKSSLLTPSPLKPISNEEFDKLALKDNRATVVQEAIYGNALQLPDSDNDFTGFMKSYRNMETRFGFALFICDLSPAIAKAAALLFTDRNIVAGEQYAYSINLVKVPEGLTVQPSVIVTDAGKVSKLPKVSEVEAIFLDKVVKLRWPVMLHKGIYSAYVLEKSTDGSNYAPISDLPLVTVSEDEDPDFFVYTDSLQRNDEQTWYRIKGVSPFGMTGPASDPVKGKGTPEFSAYVVIDTAEVTDNQKIIVRWRVTEAKIGLVKGIIISNSAKPDGPFQNLTSKPLSSSARMFTDNNPHISNYYKVTVIGTQNRKSVSFPYLVQTEDNDPPAIPEMLTGKVDSSGVVTLAWKSNSDPDLMGYRVFRANAQHEQFLRRGRDIIPNNRYTDTINLNTLTHEIYYKVIAIDKHYNNSEYSEMLKLNRPDTICPSPAIITRITTDAGKVNLAFEASPSDDIDNYKLFRNADKDSVRIIINTWNGTLPANYEDAPPGQALRYNYTLETFDKSENRAVYSRTLYVPTSKQPVTELIINRGKTLKTVVLTWNLPSDMQPQKTIIYRSKGTEPLSTYITLEGAVNSFEDAKMEISVIYTYRVRVISKNGISMPLSNTVTNEKIIK